MKNRVRRVFCQIAAWRGYYLLLAMLCVLSAAGGLFVTEMLRSALILRAVSYLPYEDYYQIGTRYGVEGKVANENTSTIDAAGDVASALLYYENVADVMLTTVFTAKAELSQFQANYEVSTKENPTFSFTHVPDSQYDTAFREVERMLVAGRHIVRGDTYTALLDAELAKLNGIGVGDTFVQADGNVYTVVGLFETLRLNPVVETAADNPLNMIFVSDAPVGGKALRTRNFYVSFRHAYTDAEVTAFVTEVIRLFGRTPPPGETYTSTTVTSVRALNRTASLGVTSMIRMSAACAGVLLLVIVTALSWFITVLMKKRAREFQLMNALGRKKNAVILDFGAELALVMLPSLALGLYASARGLIGYIRDILAYFSGMISLESVQATTTFSMQTVSGISTGIEASLAPSVIAGDAVLFLLLFSVSGVLALLLNRREYVRTPVMQVLAER